MKRTEFLHCNRKGFMKSIYQENKEALSSISYLQVVNNKPDNFSTVYTTLVECLECTKQDH